MSQTEMPPAVDPNSVKEPDDFDFLPYCSVCDEPCCNGTVYAAPHEYQRVVKKAGRDEFAKQDGTHFIEGREEDCRYLDEQYRCTVHEVRPLICALYPLYPVPTKVGLQIHVDWSCPAAEHMPEAYREKMKAKARAMFRGEIFMNYRTFWLDEPASPVGVKIPV
jgi:Fe-S-cluster containining protein